MPRPRRLLAVTKLKLKTVDKRNKSNRSSNRPKAPLLKTPKNLRRRPSSNLRSRSKSNSQRSRQHPLHLLYQILHRWTSVLARLSKYGNTPIVKSSGVRELILEMERLEKLPPVFNNIFLLRP